MQVGVSGEQHSWWREQNNQTHRGSKFGKQMESREYHHLALNTKAAIGGNMAGPGQRGLKAGSFRIGFVRAIESSSLNHHIPSPIRATGHLQTNMTSFPKAILIPTLEGLALALVLSWALSHMTQN